MATKTAIKKQTEIQSATVNRVIDKASKKVLGYLVKSDSEQGVWYQVTWNREEHRYECTCPATKPCKHERAVSEVVKARKEIEAEQAQAALKEQQQAALQRDEAVAEAEQATRSRYCDACSCVGKLQLMDGLMLCETCAEATRPVTIQTPTPVAVVAPKKTVIVTTKPLAVAKKAPTVVNKANAPLNSKTFSLTR